MEKYSTIYTISGLVALTAIILFILYIFSDSRGSFFGTVTQTGLATDAVVLNRRMGVITTVNYNILPIPPGDSVEFTFTNNQCKLNSVVLVSTEYSGDGIPTVTINGVSEGNFKINIFNGSQDALNSSVKIHFRIQ